MHGAAGGRRAVTDSMFSIPVAVFLAGTLLISSCKEASTSKGGGVPNCSFSARADTSGWQLAQLHSRAVTFRLPKSFHQDPNVRFHHGGVQWVDLIDLHALEKEGHGPYAVRSNSMI